jgi:hypothetical protein
MFSLYFARSCGNQARTALEARTAGAALRRGRRLLGVGLAFPYFREVSLDVPAAVEAI